MVRATALCLSKVCSSVSWLVTLFWSSIVGWQSLREAAKILVEVKSQGRCLGYRHIAGSLVHLLIYLQSDDTPIVLLLCAQDLGNVLTWQRSMGQVLKKKTSKTKSAFCHFHVTFGRFSVSILIHDIGIHSGELDQTYRSSELRTVRVRITKD